MDKYDFGKGDIVRTKPDILVPIIDRGEITDILSDGWYVVSFDGFTTQVHGRALVKLWPKERTSEGGDHG